MLHKDFKDLQDENQRLKTSIEAKVFEINDLVGEQRTRAETAEAKVAELKREMVATDKAWRDALSDRDDAQEQIRVLTEALEEITVNASCNARSFHWINFRVRDALAATAPSSPAAEVTV